AARLAIARDDLDGAEKILDAVAQTGDAGAVRDLVVFLTLTHKAEQTAEALEKRGEQLNLAALLYRAIGDLERARRLAEKAGDKALLGGILAEMEDYKALAKLDLPSVRTPIQKASLLWRAGDQKGFDTLVEGISDVRVRTVVCLLNGRPNEGIRGLIEQGQ